MAAGIAQLTALRERDAFAELDRLGARLADGLRGAIVRTGARADVAQVGSLATVFHLQDSGDARAPRDFAEAQAWLDTAAYATAWGEVLARGHYLAPSQFEAMFCSTAHTDADVDGVVAAIEASFAAGVGA
jgi:glutamate-1-semialdehyde 2,1-aminomutase